MNRNKLDISLMALLIVLVSCCKPSAGVNEIVEIDRTQIIDTTAVFRQIEHQRFQFSRDSRSERFDTIKDLLTELRNTEKAGLLIIADQYEFSLLFADCRFNELIDFIHEVDPKIFAYPSQAKLYLKYAKARLDEKNKRSLLEEAEEIAFNYLDSNSSSFEAANDIIYINHNLKGRSQMIDFVDSLSLIYDNDIFKFYGENYYFQFQSLIDCSR
ncbi:MAG: hypothetical protein NXI09_15880 [Bacteroidetes bacterium]|nr:hypothetical protein [Bacteroidota bacterium]